MGSSHLAQHSKVTSCKVEGNLLEYPLFWFRKERRTRISFVFNDDVDGQLIKRIFTISNGFGLPGALAQDCLVCLLLFREEQHHNDVHFYIKRIATLLFGSRRGTSVRLRQLIKKNLKLLAKTVVEFEDSFYDATNGEYLSTDIVPLFHRGRLYEHRHGKNQMEAWKENLFQLGELFERNIDAKYFNWVVFEKYKALPSGLPRRLFLYLTKKSDGGRRRDFTIGVEKLYPRLPITSKRPAARLEYLIRAAKELEKVGITHKFTNGGLVIFTFPPKLKKILEAPRVDGKTLEDLVARFYRAIGIERLSVRRKEEGVQVLARLQAEASVGAERLGQVVDWVLDRRETKFKGLHSIRLLEKAWDQALAAIVREEKKKAGAIARAKEEAAAREALAERDAARAAEIAALRAGLGAAEREDLRREALRKFENSPGYTWQLGRFAAIKDEAARDRAREELLTSFENDLLRERAAFTNS